MLSYVERVELVENTYYVAFSMSTCFLSGGACGLDLISPNQMCKALSTLFFVIIFKTVCKLLQKYAFSLIFEALWEV